MSKKEIDKKPTEREKFENEIAAINLLQQVGISFRVPLKQDEIRQYKRKNNFLNKIYILRKKSSIPRDFVVNSQKIPNPNNPTEAINYYDVEINIRPLYLETIDTLRKKRLELELKDQIFSENLNSENGGMYLLKYTREICDMLAIATVNTANERKYKKHIAEISKFYHSHLTNQRLLKLVGVIMMMMDANSFHVSTRLIMGLGTTIPREANRVEKVQSKD